MQKCKTKVGNNILYIYILIYVSYSITTNRALGLKPRSKNAPRDWLTNAQLRHTRKEYIMSTNSSG